MKRIFLFLLTNIAVLLVLSVVCTILGLDHCLTRRGLNPGLLLGFAAVFGMGGAFISLLMSKSVAKMTTGGRILSQPGSAAEAWLLATVEREARAAGIGVPEVLVYDAPEPNAFATGASKNQALVAVSTGLLGSMNQDEIEAVLGHEISHVANGDMVTLTLLQGVLNTFVLFLSQAAGYLIDGAMRRGEDDGRTRGPGVGYYVVSMLLQVVLGVLATLIVCAFSRWREFHADAGGAHLAGKRKMVAALQKLQSLHEPSTLPQNLAAFGIASTAVRNLFATHPPLEQRIARLQEGK